MPFNMLLLPLLGGYLFIIKSNYTRYAVARESGQRLIIHSAIAGVFLLAFSRILVGITVAYLPEWHDAFHEIFPRPAFEHFGTALGSFLLGGPLGWFSRIFRDSTKGSKKAIQKSGDYLELILLTAIEREKQVSITTSHGKVYIGFVLSNFDPSNERRFVKVLPMVSGYRNFNDKRLIVTTNYARVFEMRDVVDNADDLDTEDFEIVIPLAVIQSINLFDPHAYEAFLSETTPASLKNTPPSTRVEDETDQGKAEMSGKQDRPKSGRPN